MEYKIKNILKNIIKRKLFESLNESDEKPKIDGKPSGMKYINDLIDNNLYIDINTSSKYSGQFEISYKNMDSKKLSGHGTLVIAPYQVWQRDYFNDPGDYNDTYGAYTTEFDDNKYHEKYKGKPPKCFADSKKTYSATQFDAKKGWGPFLYEIALEWCSINNFYLLIDRRSVSSAAENVLNKFNSRSDITKFQLDDLDNTLTDIDDDNCWQFTYTKDSLLADSKSKAYRKNNTNIIDSLKDKGRINIAIGAEIEEMDYF